MARCFFLLMPLLAIASAQAPRPNILFFVADDLGHNDQSYLSGSKQTPTPNIDKLAWDGIILSRYYASPVCTPSRACTLSSKYTYEIGMQSSAISSGEPRGLSTSLKLMPQYLKDLGYTTWHVGKWHLGEYMRAFYPIERGFDVSYGFTGGDSNWFNYTTGWITPIPMSGRQFRNGEQMVFPNVTQNIYFPHAFNDKAEQLIHNSDPSVPWFMWFATPLVHTAIDLYSDAMHTMPEYQLRPVVSSFPDSIPRRKQQLALIQALDESFKKVVDAVVNKGVVNNTIIVYVADNGAPIPPGSVFVHGSNWGSNWPLRHGKGSTFEGGVRVPGFIWSPLLQKRGRITNQIFSNVDWLPTLYEAVGGNVSDLASQNIRGLSQWKSFQAGLSYGPRKELPININAGTNGATMIYEDQYGGIYKMVQGSLFDNTFFGWFRTPNTVAGDDSWRVWSPAQVNCNFPEGIEVSQCLPNVSACLFDLVNDPCELNNIAASYPSMLALLQAKIQIYNQTYVDPKIQPIDPAANPDLWDGLWVPWKDPMPLDNPILAYAPFNPPTAT